MVSHPSHDPGESEPFEPIETLELVGGELCLDFTNTGSGRRYGPFRERLEDYDDLMVWSERVGLLSAEQAASLRTEAARRPAEAERVVVRARALRETIYRVFSALAAGAEAAGADVEQLNEALSEAGRLRRLAPGNGGWTWTWDRGEEPLAWPLWPIAYSAGELLAAGDPLRIKECGGPDCNWLFFDSSKNRSRRWCDMKDCGNREKQRRHRKRAADA